MHFGGFEAAVKVQKRHRPHANFDERAQFGLALPPPADKATLALSLY
jgi:hypothetical protein